MIFVTGDIHADIDIGKLSAARFPRQKGLTRNDYLIVCGDFGLVWDGSAREKWWTKWLSAKRFTTLWVDGNHENFDRLYRYPLIDKFGGKVRKIAPGIFHLARGQVFTIDGRKIFAMGGATSHDKWRRKEHVSWWPQEMPSNEEMQAAVDVLDANNWQVDYVITHCAPRSVQRALFPSYEEDSLTSFLEFVKERLTFRKWFFGHYHEDVEVDERFRLLYQDIVGISNPDI